MINKKIEERTILNMKMKKATKSKNITPEFFKFGKMNIIQQLWDRIKIPMRLQYLPRKVDNLECFKHPYYLSLTWSINLYFVHVDKTKECAQIIYWQNTESLSCQPNIFILCCRTDIVKWALGNVNFMFHGCLFHSTFY